MGINILVVGASRGLGNEIVKNYASQKESSVYATVRSDNTPTGDGSSNVHWIPGIDVTSEDAGMKLVEATKDLSLDVVIITAGFFPSESFDEPKWAEELKTYTISAIAPVFIIHHLVKASCISKGGKVILVSSESGSITLRHESEGGGNYAHHASKSALNMVGKLLSLDLKSKEIAVGMVHPGFMRTEMTKGVGFDKFWDDGGAVLPREAAASLIDFVSKFDISRTGEYWAPRGPRDIGTAETVLGKDLPTPLQLPW